MGLGSMRDQAIVNESPLFAHYTDETKTDICIPKAKQSTQKLGGQVISFQGLCCRNYQREQERISLMLAENGQQIHRI
jgi:hypothetical protein